MVVQKNDRVWHWKRPEPESGPERRYGTAVKVNQQTVDILFDDSPIPQRVYVDLFTNGFLHIGE